MTITLLESYGPLALLIYSRIVNLASLDEDMKELKAISVMTSS